VKVVVRGDALVGTMVSNSETTLVVIGSDVDMIESRPGDQQYGTLKRWEQKLLGVLLCQQMGSL